jgi:hypothetical protein
MKQRILLLGQLFAAAALLAACGGGGGGDTSQPPAAGPLEAVPTSASQSTTGMATYLKTLSTLAPDDREPLDVSGFAPPKPDDTEPEPVS